MYKHILSTVSVLALSTTVAFAQATPAPTRAATPTPATTPAAPAAAAASPQPILQGGLARNVAQTAALARIEADKNTADKKATCSGKGALYQYVPPHVVGDAAPGGGYYKTNSAGTCKKIVSSKVLEALRTAGMLKNN